MSAKAVQRGRDGVGAGGHLGAEHPAGHQPQREWIVGVRRGEAVAKAQEEVGVVVVGGRELQRWEHGDRQHIVDRGQTAQVRTNDRLAPEGIDAPTRKAAHLDVPFRRFGVTLRRNGVESLQPIQ